jgi:outer membrane immunogenic protein
MKMILLAASAALVASAAPAIAQDSAPMGPDNSFAGPRAEIFGGWDRIRRTDTIEGVRDRNSKDGITGGGLLGYDLPLGDHIVVGPFASYAITSNKQCADGVGCIKTGRQIEGGARVGYKLGGSALVYGKGAYVNGRFNAKLVDGTGQAAQYVVAHTNRDGWRAGAGLQYALSKHAYVKAEYDYTRFDKFGLGTLGVIGGPDIENVRFTQNEALGGFGINF